MFKIEAGIERPEVKGRRTFPFSSMSVDESFLVPLDWAQRARNAAAHFKRTHPGWDYVTKYEVDGLRLWRIA